LLLAGVLAIAVWLSWPQVLAVRLVGVVMILGGGLHLRRQLEPKLGVLKVDRDGAISGAPNANHELIPLYALPGAIVHPWLTVVHFRDDDATRYVVIATVDSMHPDDFRRFRVFLRWRVKFAEPAGDAG
jgi:toxin CptA